MPAKWTMIGKVITTADNSASIPVVSQKFRIPTTKQNSLLKGVGLGLIFHDAIYDDVYVELWSDRAGSPSKKIATSSTTWTKAQVDASYALDYKALYMGFQFSQPLPLRKGTYYHVVLRATNYTGDDTNHIAWRHAYPDPAYQSFVAPLEAIDAASIFLETLIIAAEM